MFDDALSYRTAPFPRSPTSSDATRVTQWFLRGKNYVHIRVLLKFRSRPEFFGGRGRITYRRIESNRVRFSCFEY